MPRGENPAITAPTHTAASILTPTTGIATADTDYDYLIKLLALGDSDVGKTSLLHQFTDGQFSTRFTSTVGVDFRQKRLVRERSAEADGLLGAHQIVQLQLWDTAGQERFRSICTVFFRDAMGFLLVFDLSNAESLASCRGWMETLRYHAYCEAPDVVLVGNKCDLSGQRAVTREEAEAAAREFGIPYVETSALNSQNVDLAVRILVDLVMHRVEASICKDRIKDTTAAPSMAVAPAAPLPIPNRVVPQQSNGTFQLGDNIEPYHTNDAEKKASENRRTKCCS